MLITIPAGSILFIIRITTTSCPRLHREAVYSLPYNYMHPYCLLHRCTPNSWLSCFIAWCRIILTSCLITRFECLSGARNDRTGLCDCCRDLRHSHQASIVPCYQRCPRCPGSGIPAAMLQSHNQRKKWCQTLETLTGWCPRRPRTNPS